MCSRLMLVDGSGLLSSSFYATLVPGEDVMRSKSGLPTNGVYGMTLMLRSLLKYSNASHLMVLWDVNRNTFRREIYSLYKANRKEQDVLLKEQFGIMQDLLNEMGIAQLGIEGFEADDLVGSLVERFKDEVSITLVSKDRDYLQLLTNNNTRLWLNTSTTDRLKKSYYSDCVLGNNLSAVYKVPNNFFEYNIDNIEFLYGVRSDVVVDYKALEGDTSDNIPGVKGVGEKSIIPLLREFESIENLYDYIESTPEKDIKLFFKELGIKRSPLNSLRKGKEDAFLSKELSRIKLDIEDVGMYDLSDLKLDINQQKTQEMFRKLNFNSLIK